MTELASTTPAHALGTWLLRQRQARGLARDDVARMTRLPAATIAALESGDPRRVPRGYALGYVRTYADAIGVDADDVVRCWREVAGPDERSAPRPVPRLGLPPVASCLATLVVLALVAMTLLVLLGPRERAPLQLRKGSALSAAQRGPYMMEPPSRR